MTCPPMRGALTMGTREGRFGGGVTTNCSQLLWDETTRPDAEHYLPFQSPGLTSDHLLKA